MVWAQAEQRKLGEQERRGLMLASADEVLVVEADRTLRKVSKISTWLLVMATRWV